MGCLATPRRVLHAAFVLRLLSADVSRGSYQFADAVHCSGNNRELPSLCGRIAECHRTFDFSVAAYIASLVQLDFAQILLDLALDALQRVVDRLHVAVQVARHLLVRLTFEIAE